MEAAEHPQKIHHLAFDPGGGDAGQIREDIVAYIREHYTEELSMQDVQEDPLKKEWQPSPVFLSGKFHGQREARWVTKSQTQQEW